MNDNWPKPYIFDVRALLAWTKATGNEFTHVLAGVIDGSVSIYNRVWTDFDSAYPDEAKVIDVSSFPRARVTIEHRLTAAALVAKADESFRPMGPYDDNTELCVAGIATCESGTVVTDSRRKLRYQAINGLHVITFDEFVALQ